MSIASVQSPSAVQQPPQRGDTFRADRELHTLQERDPGQLTGEIAGVDP
jgi:hypothetical protein